MKIRNGFVSNSSSSSFLIYGVYLEEEEVIKHFGIDCVSDPDDEDYDEDEIWEKVEAIGLSYYGPSEMWDGYYFGESLSECADDQTMGDFKKQIRDEINAKTKVNISEDKFDYHEETYPS